MRPLGTSVDIGAYESVPPRDSGVPSVVESGTSLSLPVAPELLGNYPNPFNPTTRIRMLLPSDGPARLDLYDLTGQRLRTLLHESAPRGLYEVVWDGRDDAGTAVGSGVYIARLQTGQRSASMAMALIR